MMQTEYFYPELSDRTSPKEWLELNKPDLIKNAIKRKEKILASDCAAALPRELDEQISSIDTKKARAECKVYKEACSLQEHESGACCGLLS